MADPAPDGRPFPPGDYPLIVIGSGPGGLQLSYSLRTHGVEHAVLSRDPAAGRHVPQVAVLPAAAVVDQAVRPRGADRPRVPALRLEQPDRRRARAALARRPSSWTGRRTSRRGRRCRPTSRRSPSGPGIAVRYELRVAVDRDGGGAGRHDLRARDLRRRVPHAEPRARGRASPSRGARRRRASSSRATTPTPARRRRTPASGCSSSASRTPGSSSRPASRPGRRRSPSARRRPPRPRSRSGRWSGVRARYVQPFEDNFLGLGVKILDASIAAIVQDGDALRVDLKRTDTGEDDERRWPTRSSPRPASPARCWTCPTLGVTTFGQAKLPAVTPLWESANVPGICFAGTISQASPGLRKHGIPAYSGAVHGHRYNGRILARHIAETRFGVAIDRPLVAPGRHRPVPPARGDPRPRAVAPEGVPRAGASRSARTASATRGSCRSCTRWTA